MHLAIISLLLMQQIGVLVAGEEAQATDGAQERSYKQPLRHQYSVLYFEDEAYHTAAQNPMYQLQGDPVIDPFHDVKPANEIVVEKLSDELERKMVQAPMGLLAKKGEDDSIILIGKDKDGNKLIKYKLETDSPEELDLVRFEEKRLARPSRSTTERAPSNYEYSSEDFNNKPLFKDPLENWKDRYINPETGLIYTSEEMELRDSTTSTTERYHKKPSRWGNLPDPDLAPDEGYKSSVIGLRPRPQPDIVQTVTDAILSGEVGVVHHHYLQAIKNLTSAVAAASGEEEEDDEDDDDTFMPLYGSSELTSHHHNPYHTSYHGSTRRRPGYGHGSPYITDLRPVVARPPVTPAYETAADEIKRLQAEGFLKPATEAPAEAPFPGESHLSRLDEAILKDFLGEKKKKSGRAERQADPAGQLHDSSSSASEAAAPEGRTADDADASEDPNYEYDRSGGLLPLEEVQVLRDFMFANRGKRSVSADDDDDEDGEGKAEEETNKVEHNNKIGKISEGKQKQHYRNTFCATYR